MPANEPVNPPVRWELLRPSEGAATLSLSGELDSASTPRVWTGVQKELAAGRVAAMEIVASGLAYCDSAGLALLHHICAGRMTPPAEGVRLKGLSADLQHLYNSYSNDDYEALLSHEPVRTSLVEEIGARTRALMADLRHQVEFIGEW